MRLAVLAGGVGGARFLRGVRAACPDDHITVTNGGPQHHDIGCDTGSPVSLDYQSPFRFTGKIKKVEIKLEEEKLTPAQQAEVQKMHAAAEAARH